MRILILSFLVFLVALAANIQAQSPTFKLVSDPLDVRTDFVGIEVDGVEVNDCGSLANSCMGVDATGFKIVTYDVTNLIVSAAPKFTVRARTCIEGGICSEWTASVPFDFTAPAVPRNLRIVSG